MNPVAWEIHDAIRERAAGVRSCKPSPRAVRSEGRIPALSQCGRFPAVAATASAVYVRGARGGVEPRTAAVRSFRSEKSKVGSAVRARNTKNRSPLLALTLASAAFLVTSSTFATHAEAAPTIRFKGTGLDRFKFHGRVRLDPPWLGGTVDPLTSGFSFELRNEAGHIHSGYILPGDLQERRNNYYTFRDRSALSGDGLRGGVFQIITRFRQYGPDWYYTVRIMSFSDLSTATTPRMTVIFYEVGGMKAVTADWVQTQFGWRLPLNRF
jgi:hypothetical protein